jgi:glycosyltransferase involved in cell wall biosynthesis
VAVPSRTEGFGIVALEAIAAGKPVFATETGGLREFLGSLANGNHENGVSGYSAGCPKITLVKPAVEAMAIGLNQLLESRLNGKAKRNGYELPDTYSVQNSCAGYERVFLN